MAKINPFDIIKTIQDIPAKVIINREAPFTEAIDIVLPKGTLLISNTSNYNEITILSFIPKERKQFDTIKNLYIRKNIRAAKVLGYTYSINVTELKNKYECIERFDYTQLRPDTTAHIYLLSYIYLDCKIQEVDTTKHLCFISDWKPIEVTKANFENFLITHKEAINIVANQIKQQVKLKQQ